MGRDLGGALGILTESVLHGRGDLGERSGDGLVACLSGGADSSALALALAAAFGRGGVRAAHVRHGLRGSESDGDAEAVGELCARLGMPLDVLDARVEPGANLEARAREARYRALREAFPGMLLCTAHHLDDQAETVLLRLLRGAGPRGLGGIERLRSDGVWRPFLHHARSELEAACREAGWRPRSDSSNQDRAFLRNLLRLDLLPALELERPGIARSLASLAGSAQSLRPHLEAALDRLGLSLRLSLGEEGFELDLSAWDREASPEDDPELDLLLERTWTRLGRRPWAIASRRALLRDARARRGRRSGGQGEVAVFGGGRLRVEVARPIPPERGQGSRSFL